MMTDIEIAQNCKMKKIFEIGEKLGINEDDLEPYGRYKAKISDTLLSKIKDNKNGKLILVTAINPTPAGEGKTTTTVGLGEAMSKIGKKAVIALREPSLGPVFGVKGGAAGGGYAQVVPMEDINLHFTGDMHAITSCNNLLCALLDNHLQQGNLLNIDPRTIQIKRCMDMNDRALRNIVIGMGGPMSGVPREDGFIISVATEIMAILCLSSDLNDLKNRLAKILVGYTYDKKPIYAKDLKAEGAMTALMKDAIKPNLVQTLENTPAIMHGGPFANIAHGCNSIIATKTALKLADYCITEAGFGSDLGAEKFLDIKCRVAGLAPSAIVLVATVRALKYNGGVKKQDLGQINMDALKSGMSNLGGHIENMQKYGVPTIVAINKFPTDTEEELAAIEEFCKAKGARFALSKVFEEGGNGGVELANAVCEACEEKSNFAPIYSLDLPVEDKIKTVAKEIYGASGVNFTSDSLKSLARILDLGIGAEKLPVCIAKTQYSFSDNPSLLGRPKDFEITVRDIKLSNGAGFLVVFTGNILTMPGLPKIPAAEKIDVDGNGKISGLF